MLFSVIVVSSCMKYYINEIMLSGNSLFDALSEGLALFLIGFYIAHVWMYFAEIIFRFPNIFLFWIIFQASIQSR